MWISFCGLFSLLLYLLFFKLNKINYLNIMLCIGSIICLLLPFLSIGNIKMHSSEFNVFVIVSFVFLCVNMFLKLPHKSLIKIVKFSFLFAAFYYIFFGIILNVDYVLNRNYLFVVISIINIFFKDYNKLILFNFINFFLISAINYFLIANVIGYYVFFELQQISMFIFVTLFNLVLIKYIRPLLVKIKLKKV